MRAGRPAARRPGRDDAPRSPWWARPIVPGVLGVSALLVAVHTGDMPWWAQWLLLGLLITLVEVATRALVMLRELERVVTAPGPRRVDAELLPFDPSSVSRRPNRSNYRRASGPVPPCP